MNSNSYCKRLTPFGSLLAALTVIPLAWSMLARAAEAGEVITEVVRYDDLNIHSEVGRKTLLRRVTAAVDRVCPKTASPWPRFARISQDCRRETLDAAMAQIDWSVTPGANAAGQSQSERAAWIDIAPLSTPASVSSQGPDMPGMLNQKGVFVPAP